MSARYAPLPNPPTHPTAASEMDAAFDDPDDPDDDDNDDDDAAHPLARNGYHALPTDAPAPAHVPGAYDFDRTDFDYTAPPPGSPPPPSARALPNAYGNSNGLVPALPPAIPPATDAHPGWLRRTVAAALPSYYVRRLPARGAVGGGTGNDGVFANVTAKPSRPVRIQDGACALSLSVI